MFGFPGVSFLDGSGNQLGRAAARDDTTPEERVTVQPGDAARFTLAIPNAGNLDPAVCRPEQTAAIRVYPPGEQTSLRVSFRTSVCSTASGGSRVSAVS